MIKRTKTFIALALAAAVLIPAGSLAAGTAPATQTSPKPAVSSTVPSVQAGNSDGNFMSTGRVVIKDNWVYYSNLQDNYALYKVKTDGTGNQKVNNDNTSNFGIVDDWLYYAKLIDFRDDSYKLFRMKLDGTSKQELPAQGIRTYRIVGTTIYYTYVNPAVENWTINKMNLDGTKKSSVPGVELSDINFSIRGNYIYYLNGKDNGYIYRSNLDGSGKVKLSDVGTVFDMVESNGWIYFNSNNGRNEKPSLYRIKNNGTQLQALKVRDVYNFNVAGDYIYYINDRDKNLYQIKVDGSGNKKLTTEKKVWFTNIFGDNLYYYTLINGASRLVKTKLDGSSRQVMY